MEQIKLNSCIFERWDARVYKESTNGDTALFTAVPAVISTVTNQQNNQL